MKLAYFSYDTTYKLLKDTRDAQELLNKSVKFNKDDKTDERTLDALKLISGVYGILYSKLGNNMDINLF